MSSLNPKKEKFDSRKRQLSVDDIVFENHIKYLRAKEKLEKLRKEVTNENVLPIYESLGGVWVNKDGERQNVRI